MFTYHIDKIDCVVKVHNGLYLWTEDTENLSILNRLMAPYHQKMSTISKPLREMSCNTHQKDVLFLKSADTANLPGYLQSYSNPNAIRTIRIMNDSNNPILVGMPELLDILETFTNLSSLYIDNCQYLFGSDAEAIVCEGLTTLSLANLNNLKLEEMKLIAKFFPNLKTLLINKCDSINNIDDILEVMIDLFPRTEIMIIEGETYILDRT